MEGMHGAGKGDTYRPVGDQKKWGENWDAIFGKPKKPKKKSPRKGKGKTK